MTDLTKQLQSAEAGSRELDAKIWRALNMQPDWYYDSDMGGYCYMPETGKLPSGDALYSAKPLPKVTTSIDAALALVKEVLPGYGWGRYPELGIMFLRSMETGDRFDVVHKSPAIALVLALLSAAAVEGE